MVGRLDRPQAISGSLKAAHRFGPDGKEIGLRGFVKPDLDRPILIGGVPWFEERPLLWHMCLKEAAVFDIAVELFGVWRAAPLLRPIPTPADQRAHAGAALVVDDVIGVVLELGAAILVHHAGQAQPRAQIQQHRLKATHIAVRVHHRPADAVPCCTGFRDRPVQQADAIVAFQIGGVGQDQVGVGHHLGRIGVGIDDAGNDIVAAVILVGEHPHHLGRVHRRVPRHIGHVEEQRVDAVGITRMGVGDQHVHQPMGRQRVFPRKRLVDPQRIAIRVNRQLLRPAHIAQMRPGQGFAGGGNGMGRRMRLNRFWVGWFQPIATGHLDRSQHDLKHVQRAGGLEAVGMGRNSTHGVEGHRAAGHRGVMVAAEIGPRLIQHKGLVEGDASKLGGKAADSGCCDAAALGNRFGRVFGREIAFGHVLEHSAMALIGRTKVRLHPLAVPRCGLAGAAVNHEGLAFGILQDHALVGTIAHHQKRRVGELRQIIEIDLTRLQKAVDQGQDQQPIGAGRDAKPIIGHRVIARADRVDANHLAAPALQLAKADFDRVGIMVLGHTEEDKQLGAVPVGLAEFPKRAANGVDAACGHVDRTEPTVSGIVRRAIGLRPPAGQRLALVTPGEKGQLFGGCVAQGLHP